MVRRERSTALAMTIRPDRKRLRAVSGTIGFARVATPEAFDHGRTGLITLIAGLALCRRAAAKSAHAGFVMADGRRTRPSMGRDPASPGAALPVSLPASPAAIGAR